MGVYQILLILSFQLNGIDTSVVLDNNFNDISECRALVTDIRKKYDTLYVDNIEIQEFDLTCKIPGYSA